MITLDEVLQLHEKSIRDYEGSLGVRDMNLPESAVVRPLQSFGGTEFYPTPFDKAAAIIESIVRNHPFIDGNKRTGFLAGFALLYRVGLLIAADQEMAYNFVIDIASSNISFEDIGLWPQQNTQPISL
ncbi:type II toxin-antitoxin system death-on-curing family toxin [Ilyomonas limi]|uniref:Type II toxin-antitoxin system death-on-curing family toxin n=1 Tax=Ilyomonas limi TaxID=2575867 RepID=A0A4U3KZD3_9BACT|nr:type II toxin-antitoxin system death-on-curing family toxin [Ilyomonas limi]TKK67812.1 type II toxin-antitoxin system death-on-curing family toxin [Ilyomonas limi]